VALFKGILGGGFRYDVSADGKRILVEQQVIDAKPPETMTLVQNWTALMKK
jgi:hypothetical protein